MDQAASLLSRKQPAKVIAVTSGKGGVGKTNIVAGLACSLADMGRRVMILDADLGLANLDVLLGFAPKYNLSHVFSGEMGLAEIIVDGPKGIKVIPASSGLQEITHMGPQEQRILLDQMEALENQIDYLFIDTAAGISEMVTSFLVASHAAIVVVTPEPTSMTDAYALMKVMHTRFGRHDFHLLLNVVQSQSEAVNVFTKLNLVCEKFLDISVDFLGYIPLDKAVREAVRQQRAVVDLFPEAPASQQLMVVARELEGLPVKQLTGGLQFFWRRLLNGEPARE
ncbi:MAG: MinD/ParA family protein [Deltaproteobacteria bacterium]|nr:MinD/ParA family protein [Candidatus Anaeroferrophillus wilburensis]MBN2889594.1 MinD/ParA family protein [Deltaproteobacteria bacterium]